MNTAPLAARAASLPAVAGLAPLAERYDGFILDLWGCLHNGIALYPGVPGALAQLRRAGKRVLLLSNAPRRAAVVREGLRRHFGLAEDLYDEVLTSGEMAWQALAEPGDDWHRALGKRCFRIGPDRDTSMIEGNGLEVVDSVEAASFVMVTGSMEDRYGVAYHEPLLREALARSLPMLGANPDLVVMRGAERYICAGSLARRYAELGGDVRQHGKPYREVYARALDMLDVDPGRVVGIGDSLATDIAGARGAGIASAFIPGGIHGEHLGLTMGTVPDAALLDALYAEAGERPDWVLAEIRW